MNFETLEEYRRSEEIYWQMPLVQQKMNALHERVEEKVRTAAHIRHEIQTGARVSDEEINITFYQWIQRFLYKADRYMSIDVQIGGVNGRLVFDLLDQVSWFEPKYTEKSFLAANGLDWVNYESFSFGENAASANQLAWLVKRGIKRATSSLYVGYELHKEPLPTVGDQDLILYADGSVCCAIKTTAVSVIPFDQVTRHHAYLEGEGDRSLSYWRAVHHVFFKRMLFNEGIEFSTNMDIVLEEFQVIS